MAVRDADSISLPSYSLAACKPVTGDVLDAKVTWATRKTIRHKPIQSLRLAFELRKDKLYSFWID